MARTMFGNRLNIAKQAISKLSLTTITDLHLAQDGSKHSDEVLSELFVKLDIMIHYLLEQHPWQFAIRSKKMVKDPKTHFYYIPSDHLRFVGVGDIHQCRCINTASTRGTKQTNGLDLVEYTNEYLRSQNANEYVSNVSFREVNGQYDFNIAGIDKDQCNYYDTLYYIHADIEEMRMPASFILMCGIAVASQLPHLAKSDPNGNFAIEAIKEYRSLLFTAIENSFKEFKYSYTFTTKQVEHNVDGLGMNSCGFKTNPMANYGNYGMGMVPA